MPIDIHFSSFKAKVELGQFGRCVDIKGFSAIIFQSFFKHGLFLFKRKLSRAFTILTYFY